MYDYSNEKRIIKLNYFDLIALATGDYARNAFYDEKDHVPSMTSQNDNPTTQTTRS